MPYISARFLSRITFRPLMSRMDCSIRLFGISESWFVILQYPNILSTLQSSIELFVQSKMLKQKIPIILLTSLTNIFGECLVGNVSSSCGYVTKFSNEHQEKADFTKVIGPSNSANGRTLSRRTANSICSCGHILPNFDRNTTRQGGTILVFVYLLHFYQRSIKQKRDNYNVRRKK